MANNLSIRQNQLYLLWSMFSSLGKTKASLSMLPKNIEDYSLIRELDSGELRKPHRIGIYKNQKGEKSVVKYWSGNSKNFAYYSLLHEISMMTLLEKLRKRSIARASKEIADLNTPCLIAAKVSDKNIMMMTEFKEGRLLRETPKSRQITEYKKAIKFLKVLSENLTDKETKILPKRDLKDYFLLYPAILVVAIIRQPKLVLTFLKGAPYTLFALLLLRNQPLSLVHRDLHTQNILTSSKRSTVIDLQRVVLTYPLYELVTTLAVEWDNKEVRLAILKHAALTYPKSINIFRGLLVHFATHALTANNLPNYYLTRYKAMLKFAVNDFSINNY